MIGVDAVIAPRARARESWHIQVARLALYAVSLTLYTLPLSSWAGTAAAALAGVAGIWLAGGAHRRALRIPLVLVLGPLGLVAALMLGEWIVDARPIAGLLGIKPALVLSEVVSFGLAALCAAFMLRFLSLQARPLSMLEVLFVAGSAAAILADHRNRMLNRPRFFSDWAWALGINPTTVLMVIGILATVVAILLFLRGQRLLKLITTLLLLAALGVLFFLYWDKRIESVTPPDALGLSGKGKRGDGKGGGAGGRSDDPFKDDYSGSSPPSPVAIAILRDDFDPISDILYFRQTALSVYNGHHLVNGSKEGWDQDVITQFPRVGTLSAKSVQSDENHIDVPTTMYLLVDHPQPLGLTHAARIQIVENPNPRQFVAAYDVRSKVLSVQPDRLFGRRSIPRSWPEKLKSHYLELPDDPRYLALADIIVRDVDPRFFGDDLARAFAIKRHLERQGFYTMKSTHSSRKDPTASFLFGSLRGYCVHFAHAAAYLMRTQGIAARVALGYAVQINKRSGGSTILIMSDRAHAWPEIHLEGIGWVTFDIYPERTDMRPPTPVDYDLEKLLGELARKDETAGVDPEGSPLRIPWGTLLTVAGLALASLLLLSYLIKIYRRLAPRLRGDRLYPRLAYLAVLDLLSDLGLARTRGETRERHAARLARLAPGLEPLTRAHLAIALGSSRAVPDRTEFSRLVYRVRDDLRANIHAARRLVGLLNPIGWIWTK